MKWDACLVNVKHFFESKLDYEMLALQSAGWYHIHMDEMLIYIERMQLLWMQY